MKFKRFNSVSAVFTSTARLTLAQPGMPSPLVWPVMQGIPANAHPTVGGMGFIHGVRPFDLPESEYSAWHAFSMSMADIAAAARDWSPVEWVLLNLGEDPSNRLRRQDGSPSALREMRWLDAYILRLRRGDARRGEGRRSLRQPGAARSNLVAGYVVYSYWRSPAGIRVGHDAASYAANLKRVWDADAEQRKGRTAIAYIAAVIDNPIWATFSDHAMRCQLEAASALGIEHMALYGDCRGEPFTESDQRQFRTAACHMDEWCVLEEARLDAIERAGPLRPLAKIEVRSAGTNPNPAPDGPPPVSRTRP